MPRVMLDEAAQVTLDSSGDGTAKLGPAGHGVTWHPEVASVEASTNTSEASCKIYVGAAATDQTFVDGTFSGSSGDSTDRVKGRPVWLPHAVWAVWSGGDSGATATLRVTGRMDIP